MHYSCFGLATTKSLLTRALNGGYAVPGFNFYNMETLQAILRAGEITQSPIILQVSEEALNYMTEDILMGMIAGAKYRKNQIALHLDHGHSFESCQRAIDIGFSSVMFDGSALTLSDNIKISRRVADYAHKFDVSVETELGVLAGIEDENTASDSHNYTDPSIGTSHGAYKTKNKNQKLRFDILQQIATNIPKTPLVLHGASSIPQKFVNTINKFGGDINGARGIPSAQLRHAIALHITKINVDSDSRLAFTAAVRETLSRETNVFNPRKYLTNAMDAITKNCIDEIQNIMGSGYKI